MVSRFDYAPYGEVIRSLESGDLVSFTYTGQEMDKHLGVMNYNARLYDPSLSRFLSADPLREFHSPYNYVGNNPFSFTDPSGMNSSIPLKEVPVPTVTPLDPLPYTNWGTDYWGAYSASNGTGPMQSAASDAARVDMGKGFRTLSEIKEEEFDHEHGKVTLTYSGYTAVDKEKVVWLPSVPGQEITPINAGYIIYTDFVPTTYTSEIYVDGPAPVPFNYSPIAALAGDNAAKSAGLLHDNPYAGKHVGKNGRYYNSNPNQLSASRANAIAVANNYGRVAQVFRYADYLLQAANVMSVYNREGSYGPATQEQVGVAAGSIVLGTAVGSVGATIGASFGGLVGLAFGGVGAVPGAAIGSFVGGIVGGYIGGDWGGSVGRRVARSIIYR